MKFRVRPFRYGHCATSNHVVNGSQWNTSLTGGDRLMNRQNDKVLITVLTVCREQKSLARLPQGAQA